MKQHVKLFEEFIGEDNLILDQITNDDYLNEDIFGIKNPFWISALTGGIGMIINIRKTKNKVAQMLLDETDPEKRKELEKKLSQLSSEEIDYIDDIKKKEKKLAASNVHKGASEAEKAKAEATAAKLKAELVDLKDKYQEITKKYEDNKSKVFTTHRDWRDYTKPKNLGKEILTGGDLKKGYNVFGLKKKEEKSEE